MIKKLRKWFKAFVKILLFIFDISVELELDRAFDNGKMTVYFDRMISQLFTEVI